MRLRVSRSYRPFRGHIQSHLEKVSLGMLDKLRSLVAQQPDKHFLRDIIQIRRAYRPSTGQKFAQRRSPSAIPLAYARGSLWGSHATIYQSSSTILIRPDTLAG